MSQNISQYANKQLKYNKEDKHYWQEKSFGRTGNRLCSMFTQVMISLCSPAFMYTSVSPCQWIRFFNAATHTTLNWTIPHQLSNSFSKSLYTELCSTNIQTLFCQYSVCFTPALIKNLQTFNTPSFYFNSNNKKTPSYFFRRGDFPSCLSGMLLNSVFRRTSRVLNKALIVTNKSILVFILQKSFCWVWNKKFFLFTTTECFTKELLPTKCIVEWWIIFRSSSKKVEAA